mgnify:CR=1 FL=1
MIQMKDMLNLFPKIPLYYNIPSKHAEEKCLNADFLTAGRLLQNKHFEGSCELLSLNLILMLTSC